MILNKRLSEEERVIVLSHEEGHIWNGHMTSNNVFGDDVKQEFEANEFSHFLLEDWNEKKRHRKIVACCSIILLIVPCGVVSMLRMAMTSIQRYLLCNRKRSEIS